MAAKKLSSKAYEIEPGETYIPYTAGETLPEFTLKAAISGIVLGVVFGAANTYLGLKAGLTISTSIPVAVLTVVVFRLLGAFGMRHSILELNMSQTIGSASSSVASGVLFTIPALFIWNMNPPLRQITLLAMCGGLIGVLAMIPLRRYLIKQEHGKLPYPEGLACAEVLVAAEGGGRQATPVFLGIGVGMLFKLITDGFKFVRSEFEMALGFKASVAISVSPALIGVGYILGIRIATVMVAGGALSAFVIIPLINLWGSSLSDPLFPETVKLIRDMSSGEIWNRYVRYIGAGAVATGGMITLIKSIPTMIESFKLGIAQIGKKAGSQAVEPTDRDLSFKTGSGASWCRLAHPDAVSRNSRVLGLDSSQGPSFDTDRGVRILFCNRELTNCGSCRRYVESDFGHDDRYTSGYELDLLSAGLDRHDGQSDRPDGGHGRLHRGFNRWRHLTRSQNRISARSDSTKTADR